MRITYLSDIHLEYISYKGLQYILNTINSGDICVLSGDIGNPYQPSYDTFIKHISHSFRKTFIIAGNHEYYNEKNISQTKHYLTEYFKQFPNISFLDNSYEIFETYCFIGTTLWSHITHPEYATTDMKSIPNFNYIKYNKLNNTCIDFLINTLKTIGNISTIIITHHIPSKSLIHPKYKSIKHLHQWFYSDLDNLIQTYPNIKYWFYGHTHTPYNVLLYNVRFLCNPIGYPNENHKIKYNTYIDL